MPTPIPPESLSLPIDCKYLLDDSTSATLVLPDGRKLGYAEYGARTGQPVLYMPGFPSSRIEGAGFDPEATKVGARIIAVDRPGYGLSSPHAEGTLLSHAQDVGVLANHLGLRRYGVLGISGGGPYALACARVLPADQLRAVSIVCGLGSPDMGYRGMNTMSWLGWTYGQRLFPGFCRWWFSREAGAQLDLGEAERMKLIRQAFEKDKANMHPKDVPVLCDRDFMWMHLRRAAEVYRQGMDGLSRDFRLLNSDFGFKIEDIRKDLPVQLWHGRLDNMVPLQHAEKVKARLGDNAHLKITDDTHAGIWAMRKEEYLAELVKAIKA